MFEFCKTIKTNDIYINLYRSLYKNLVSLADVAGLTESDIQKYFIPEGNTTSKSILYRLCSSLQNSGMMHNSIRFNSTNSNHRQIIGEILFDFNAQKSYETYTGWENIYNEIIDAGITDNGVNNGRETNWQKYCKGLYDGIKYLTDENGENEIVKLCECDTLTDDKLTTTSNISHRIHGLGFALTCDWLKECGCSWLAKPDEHIKKVIMHMENNDKLTDKEILKHIFSWAETVVSNGDNVTAYKIDRIIWLLCTGAFYLDDVTIGRNAVLKNIDSQLKQSY